MVPVMVNSEAGRASTVQEGIIAFDLSVLPETEQSQVRAVF